MATDINLLYTQIKTAVVNLIAANATIIANIQGGVKDYILDDITNAALPHVIVSLENCVPQVMSGDTEAFRFEFPVAVLIRGQAEANQAHNQVAKYTGCHMAIYAMFHQRPRIDGITLDGVPEVYKSSVRLRPVIDSQRSKYPNLISSMELRFEAKILRWR